MVSPITIDGLSGFTQTAKSETITNQYRETVTELQSLLNSPTDTGIDQVENLVNKLKNLLINGVAVPIDASHPNGRAYLTPQMANQLTLLFESLRLAGYDTSGHISLSISSYLPEEQDTALLRFMTWRGLVNSSQLLQSLYNFASTQYVFERSLQAMVELDYVKTGNDLLSEKVADLDNALSVTKSSLDTLAALQNAHNQTFVNSKGSFTSVTGFNWNPTGKSPSAFAYSTGGYVKAASSFFGTPISPDIFNVGDPITYKLEAWQTALVKLAADGATLVAPSGSYNPPLYGFTVSMDTFNNDAFYILQLKQDYFQCDFETNSTASQIASTKFPGINIPANSVLVAQSTGTPSNLYQDMKATKTLLSSGTGITYVVDGNFSITIPWAKIDASAYFSRVWGTYGMIPEIIAGAEDLDKLKKELVRLKTALLTQINALIPITPLVNGQRDPDSLLAKLQTVYDDLNGVYKTFNGQAITSATPIYQALAGLSKWLIDGANLRNTASSNLAGKFQQNITFAITAGQSLNDQQKEQVRRFLYVFEEFYKSASAILQKITQILERMAQSISR